MKKPLTALLLLLSTVCTYAQLNISNNTIRSELAGIVSDHSENYRHYIGNEKSINPQSTEYSCRVALSNASDCSIIKYSATYKSVYSWQATMLVTDDFQEAEKKFRSLYQGINNMAATVNGRSYTFKAGYTAPSENLKFTSIVFQPEDQKEGLKLRVELLLQTGIIDWTISLMVYEKQKNDDERGPVIE